MQLKLFNSLTRKIEEFKPLNPSSSRLAGQVGMYICGPTVYDFMHIGNLRTFIFSDILLRVLMANGFFVKSVRNITDIDDKIIKKAKEKNAPLNEITDQYTKLFFEDLNKLNILPVDINPKATEHVGAMIKFIEQLLKKELAYVQDDGSVYFDISKFADYGKLSGLEARTLKTGTRILSDEYTKDNVQDFALWKSVEADEVGGYSSPWGRGRPGWHIECSVMSQQYLGDTFDIHTGGVDLIFPHHENEIAQSEGKTGKKFVNYFVHGEHILVDGQKMSKSLNNFFTLKDLEEKTVPAGRQGFDPLSLRYLFLTAHYRDKLNFTWKSLGAAANALNNLREQIRAWEKPKVGCAEFEQRFMEAASSDLNMPQAVAVMWEMVRSDYPTSSRAKSILMMDKILGLKLDEYLEKPIEISEEVEKLVEEREEARKSGDFEKADKIRKQVNEMGFQIEDTNFTTKLKRDS